MRAGTGAGRTIIALVVATCIFLVIAVFVVLNPGERGSGGLDDHPLVAEDLASARADHPQVGGTAAEHVRRGDELALEGTSLSVRAAYEEYRKALSLDDASTDALMGIAYISPELERAGADFSVERALSYCDAVEDVFPDDPRPHRIRAHVSMSLRGYEAGLEEWGKVLALYPRDPEALMETGRCLMELERFDQAAGFLTKRVAVGEDPTDALLMLAETQRRARDIGSALETLERVPTEGRRGARAAVAMADIFAEVGATESAREKVRVALRLDGNDAEALLRDAIYRYQDEGDLDAAAENLLRLLAQPSIDRRPELRDRASRHLGTIYRLDGALGKAHRYLDPLVARDPLDIPAHFQLAKVRLAEADVADAIGPYTAALEQSECDEARAWFLLGQMHMHGQNLEAAVESFHHAIELEPGYAPATFSLIHFLAQFDNPQEVRRLIRDLYTQAAEEPVAARRHRDFHVLFDLAPLEQSVLDTSDQLEQTDAGSVEHTMLEALFYDHLGDHERAAPLYLAVAEGRAGEPIHWLHLGTMAWDDGRIDEAAGHFGTAVEQAPTRPLYLYLAARMLEEEARNDRARELYDRLLEYRPGHVLGAHGLARLDHRLGDLDGAHGHYAACHAADDEFLPAWRDHLLLDMGEPLVPGVL